MLQSWVRCVLGAFILVAFLGGCSKSVVTPTNIITGSEAGDNKYPYQGGMPKDINKSGSGTQGKGPVGGPTGSGSGRK